MLKMWSPRQHFSSWIILIYNYLSKYSNCHRFLLSFLFISLSCSSVPLQAQFSYKEDHPELKKDPGKTLSPENKPLILQKTVLDFEGPGNQDEILEFYNGGESKDGYEGQDLGIAFSRGAVSITGPLYAGPGKLTLQNLSSAVLCNLSGNQIVINTDPGFINGFAFRYIAADTGSVYVYSGYNGTGRLLSSEKFDQTDNPNDWERSIVHFTDTARSVMIRCKPVTAAFDELVFSPDYYRGPGNNRSFKSLLAGTDNMSRKGSFDLSVSTRFGFPIGKNTPDYGGSSTDGYNSAYYDLNFLPKAGYFVTNHVTCGLFLDFEIYNNKPKDESLYGYKGTTVIIGPYARYSLPVSRTVVPFAEAQAGYGFDRYNSRTGPATQWDKSNTGIFSFRLGGGAVIYLTENIGLDILLGYMKDSYQDQDQQYSGRSANSKTERKEFIMQMGIIVGLI